MSRLNERGIIKPQSEKGAILILVAVGMTTLVGFMGLALDVGVAYNHKRYMQTAADAGALAGAYEIFRGQTHTTILASAQDGTKINGFDDAAAAITVTVNHPPTSGYYATDSDFVEVIINQPSPTYFMKVFGWIDMEVPARAVAGIAGKGKACLYALDTDSEKSFWATSSARLNAPNCGIQIDSQANCAFQTESNSNINAKYIDVAGSTCQQGGTVNPAPKNNAVPKGDPLQWLQQPPSNLPCTFTNKMYKDVNVTVTMPGTTVPIDGTDVPYVMFCGGLVIDGSATVVDLKPGLYIFKGRQDKAALQMKGAPLLKCTDCTGLANSPGVTLFFTGDGADGLGSPHPYRAMKIESSSRLQLRAPTTGPYAGILLMDDRKVPECCDADNSNIPFTHVFESSSDSFLEGGMYFPNHALNFESSSNNTTAAAYSFIIARTVEIESNIQWNLMSNLNGLGPNNPLKRVSLVE